MWPLWPANHKAANQRTRGKTEFERRLLSVRLVRIDEVEFRLIYPGVSW